ncbi:MAG: hypothetical protein D6B26_01855 [Spirochaetaceae bacterium]|nr:MAG: hypothetical protein D6B26_01855 [Spirochaetaceae bacterium]
MLTIVRKCILNQPTGSTGSISDDAADAIGEVVNIIAGNAKKGLEQYVLTISLPALFGVRFTISAGHSESLCLIC